jgi:hypothetical protein
LQEPTLNLGLEITESKKSVINSEINLNQRILTQVPILLQGKMARGIQMRVGACEGFPNNSVRLVLLANGNSYDVDSSTFSPIGKWPFIH